MKKVELENYIWTYKIKEFSNYDGDSFRLTLDLGFGLVNHVNTRIFGIDTPELRGGTVESKAAGKLARDYANRFVQNAIDSQDGGIFHSQNYSGKFGRPLGDIVNLTTGESLAQELVSRRMAVVYEGQAKSEIQEKHDANIAFLKKWGELSKYLEK